MLPLIVLTHANNSPFRYCENVAIDSRIIWLIFVECSNASEPQAYFVSFLMIYVQNSLQKRVVLGPKEYEWKQTVNSAFFLTEVWRRFVAAAEYYVMRLQRKTTPSEAATWALRWMNKEKGAREGPAYLVVKVCFSRLKRSRLRDLPTNTPLAVDILENCGRTETRYKPVLP
jgi:hypothetical protein